MIENTALPTTGQAIADLLGCGIGAVQKRFEAVRSARFPSKGWDDTWKWNPANPLPKDCAKNILLSFLGDYQEVILPIIQPPNALRELLAQRNAFAILEKEHAGLKNAFADLGKASEQAVRDKESAQHAWQKKQNEWEDLVHRYNELFDSSKTTQNAFAELGKRFADLEKQNQIFFQNGKTNDATFAELGKQKAAFAKLEKDFAILEKERNHFAESAKRFPILEKEHDRLKARFAELGKESESFSQIGKSYSDLQTRFAYLEKENAVWKDRFADLEKGNLSFADSAKQESERLVKELMQHKDAEALNRKTIQEQESEIHTFYETKSRLEHEIREIREKKEFLSKENEDLKEFRKKYRDLKEQWDSAKMAKAEIDDTHTAFAQRYAPLVGTLNELSGSFRILLGITESICFYASFERLGFVWWVSMLLAVVLSAIFQGKLLKTALEATADVCVNGSKNSVLDSFAVILVAILVALGVKISIETRTSIRNAYPVFIVDSAKTRALEARFNESTTDLNTKYKLDTTVAGNHYCKNVAKEDRNLTAKWNTAEGIAYIRSLNTKDSLAMVTAFDAAEKRRLAKWTPLKAALELDRNAIPNLVRSDFGHIAFILDMIAMVFVVVSALAVAIYQKETSESPRIESIPMRIWAKWSGEFWTMIEELFKI